MTKKDDCVKELGYAWIYMHYLRPGWLQHKACKKQKERVKTLMMECAVEWHKEYGGYWDNLHERIIDEIENMC
jgi:hypothetical protein